MTAGGYPQPGTAVEDLDTPAVVIDLEVAEANLSAMRAFLNARSKALRAHAKFHKSAYWAVRQLRDGAIGICVATLGEAEAMVDAGIDAVLIANEVVGAAKIARVAALAKRSEIILAVDSAANADELSTAASAHGVQLGVLVDVNVRMNRCGVEPGAPAAALAKHVAELPGIQFEGLMGYEGHIRGPGRREETLAAMQRLADSVAAVERAGLRVRIVSAGGTSTYDITATVPEVTELQCGSYLFMDAAYHREVPAFKPALRVIAAVISRPTQDRVIVDAGFKSICVKNGPPELLDVSGYAVSRLNAEHAILVRERAAPMLDVGSRISLLPSNSENTINLHDEYFCVRAGRLEAVVPVDARGRGARGRAER